MITDSFNNEIVLDVGLNIFSGDFETDALKLDSTITYQIESRFICLVHFYHQEKRRYYFNVENKSGKEKLRDFLFSFNTKKRGRLYFHNLNFDFSFLFYELPEGLNLDINLVNSTLLRIQLFRYYIKKLNGRDKRYKKTVLEFRNSFTLFRTSLRQLGTSLNCPKLEQDYQSEITREYIEYCFQDCLIPIKALENLITDINDDYKGINMTIEKIPLTISSVNKKIFNFLGYQQYGKKEFINLVYHPSVKSINPFVRPKFSGGRVEIYDFNPCFQGSYNDVNSLYTNPMLYGKFPSGKITRYECSSKECINLWNSNPFVFACEAEFIETHDPPLVPVKINDKLIFPVGKKEGFLFRQEVNRIKELGGRITRLIAVYTCELYMNPFQKYLPPLIEKKSKSKGFKRDQYKVRQNGLYGKFGEKLIKEACQLLKSLAFLDENELNKVEPYEYQGKIYHVKKDSFEASYLKTNIIYAMFIVNMARLIIYENILTARYKKYTDTDSIVSDKRDTFDYDDFQIGKMKKEFTFKHFQALGCKEYVYLTNDVVKYNVLMPYIDYSHVIYKMKGFGKRDEYTSVRDFVIKYFAPKKQHRQVGFMEALNQDIPMNTFLVFDKYKRNVYDKRWINNDFTTRAFHLQKDNLDDLIKNNEKMIDLLIKEYESGVFSSLSTKSVILRNDLKELMI